MSIPRACALSTRRAVSFGAALFLAAAAWGQGTILVDDGIPIRDRREARATPMEIRYQRVSADVTDGVAVVTVKQTFRNPLPRPIEGVYLFPLPDGVAVGNFKMTADGKTLSGEVLEKDAARKTYEDIVRRMRDPGLLEYVGGRLYQARVFPIPPGGTLDVELSYTYPIPEHDGLGQLSHPLRCAARTAGRIGQFVLQVSLKSTLPLTSVFCPTHRCEVIQKDDHHATVTMEVSDFVPERDFALYYQRKDAAFGLSVLAHRTAGENGYFLMRLSPRIEYGAQAALPKDIVFVIDTSGSMAGGKLEQVKRSLKYCIQTLGPEDRFNILTFSTSVRPFREAMSPADADFKQAAVDFTDKMQATGGTNINNALTDALALDSGSADRPFMVVFMTDGLPTVDVTDPAQILRNVTEANRRSARVFVLGVGSDVNALLLDKIAEENRGARDYCIEGEDLELKLSAFAGRLSKPVMTDVRLDLPGLTTYDVYPQRLPDLFAGDNILVVGRYDGEGKINVELSGRVAERSERLIYQHGFPRLERDHDFLPQLWANRKVAYLLDAIRIHGENPELREEVIQLATRYGIVTPYTSALIIEDGAAPVASTAAPALRVMQRAAEAAPAPAAGGVLGRAGGARGGRGAVVESRDIAQLKALAYVDADADGAQMEVTREGKKAPRIVRLGALTFLRDGERLLDTRWDGKTAPRTIEAFSTDYFTLFEKSPDIAAILALGERIVFLLDGEVIEVVPAPEAEKPAEETSKP